MASAGITEEQQAVPYDASDPARQYKRPGQARPVKLTN